MDKSSVSLESSYSLNMGETVNLDLFSLEEKTSLFPGEIVAMSAHKGRQGAVAPTKIYSDATLNLPQELPQLNTSGA